LKSTLAPQRTFTLKVKEVVEGKMFIWGDGMGQRIYTLEKRGRDTQFFMIEKIGGPLFPLFSSMIPPFDHAFEQFASDLKKEAETIMNQK